MTHMGISGSLSLADSRLSLANPKVQGDLAAIVAVLHLSLAAIVAAQR